MTLRLLVISARHNAEIHRKGFEMELKELSKENMQKELANLEREYELTLQRLMFLRDQKNMVSGGLFILENQKECEC